MAYESFENLEVWKSGCRVAVRIYEILKTCKDYGLKDQMTRAAVSISSNTRPMKLFQDGECHVLYLRSQKRG